MRAHLDGPRSEDVRLYGAPLRLYVHTRNWTLILGARSQRWTKEKGYGDMKYRFLTRHPKRERTCRATLEEHVECSRLRGHEGPHWNWKRGQAA